jgi:predicted esterase
MFFKAGNILLHGRFVGGWGEYGKRLFIYSPGARGNTLDSEVWIEPLEDKGYSTFSYDLRGMGKSKGSQLEFEKQIHDIKSAIDAATKKFEERFKNPPNQVILIGHSLGAVASLTIGVQDPRVNLVFGLSSLYSIEDFTVEDNKENKNQSLTSPGKRILKKLKDTLSPPWWFKQFLSFVSKGQKITLMPKYYLTDELVKKVYLIHGTKDEYVPFEKSGKKIIEKYNLSKDRYLLVNAGHSLEDYLEEILNWIVSKL